MTSLYIVPTPIGNLKDITYRAIEVLKNVDLILAEDTRNSLKLLKHYEIKTSCESFHMHNEHSKLNYFIDKIKSGKVLALISDAGTPGISDPGYLLIREVISNNYLIECLPGATAIIPSLVQSGFPIDKFVFEGFLPLKKSRKKRLEFLSEEKRSLVIFESPHRIIKTLNDLVSFFGKERKISISRELTKIHEETIRGTLSSLLNLLNDRKLKGECVLLIGKDDKNVYFE